MTDVAVIGGGIAGCATAALLAERGAAVTVYEREAIGAGASGRNSGVLQHPLDPVLTPLFEASLELYRGLGHGFTLPPEPSGVIALAEDGESLRPEFDELAAEYPELSPEWLDEDALRAAEPGLGEGLCGYRIADGLPIGPTAATRAWAERAREAGARIVIGHEAVVRPGGVQVDGRLEPAGAVVVAAGPWSSEALGAPLPVTALWGVVAQVRLPTPPRQQLEEAGVKALISPGAAPPRLFSIVTTGEVSAVGSSFSATEPDPAAVAPTLLERGARYLPALADATIEHVRACARPLSADGRPLLGAVPGTEGVYLVTGHGAWGVTQGPGSARLVVDAIEGRDAIPAELSAARLAR